MAALLPISFQMILLAPGRHPGSSCTVRTGPRTQSSLDHWAWGKRPFTAEHNQGILGPDSV